MRLPRLRFTIRRLMVAAAVVAALLTAAKVVTRPYPLMCDRSGPLLLYCWSRGTDDSRDQKGAFPVGCQALSLRSPGDVVGRLGQLSSPLTLVPPTTVSQSHPLDARLTTPEPVRVLLRRAGHLDNQGHRHASATKDDRSMDDHGCDHRGPRLGRYPPPAIPRGRLRSLVATERKLSTLVRNA